eukprot:TRINITY_DN22617_c0_g1_i1.p1 TRINITY_DN22617_c0_g1~~TRINITY_DN22617_c0_g1_i1.p1  ORF type:complete len:987 (+),score=246.95 TRINITY_DN22617_c0_g1_i1:49-3009(+)
MPTTNGEVQVVVRMRPCLAREVDAAGRAVSCVGVDDAAGRVYLAADGGGGPVVVDTDATAAGPAAGVWEYKYDRALRGDCSEDDVYAGPVRGCVHSVVEGFNATVFAYGQSGSGKTHTISHLLPRVLADLLAGGGAAPPTLSVLQIYKETTSDLLDPATPTLPVLSAAGVSSAVPAASQAAFRTVDEALALVDRAVRRRAVGATDLNEVSSRSHLIIQISLEGSDGSGDGGKLSLIDLAGSERLKQSKAEGERLEEAKAINLSLFTLVNVVRCLVENASHVPYRSSKLTQLLRDSLGGSCHTVMIGTISPSLDALEQTQCTLNFAAACGKVVNKPKKREPTAPKPAPKPKKEAKKVAPWEGEASEYEQTMLNTAVGTISVLTPPTPREPGWDPVVLMHGCPSSAAEYLHWFPVLRHCKCWPIAIDQPGFGASPGTPHKSRSEFNLAPGGPVDVALAVMRAMNVTSAHMMGYDWGGGAVLSFGMRHPLKCKSVLSLLPSYQEVKKGELAKLGPRTLIAWITSDQFHSWKKWQPLAKMIPNVTIATEKTRAVPYALELPVVRFLTGTDPFQTATEVKAAKKTAEVTTRGDAITMVHQVALKRDLSEKEQAGRHAATGENEAVAHTAAVMNWIRSTPAKEVSAAFRQCVNDANATCLRLFANLPELSPGSIDDGAAFMNLNVWPREALRNRDVLEGSQRDVAARYPRGRAVLVRQPRGSLNINYTTDTYMHVEGAAGRTGGGEEFVSHLGVVESYDPAARQFTVSLPTTGKGEVVVSVPERALLVLNDGHEFATSAGNGRVYYLFEDGMRGSYSSRLVKGKVAEIAAVLAPLVQRLDFKAPDCLAVQQACVEAVRKCLNTTVFADGLDRTRISRTDDLGKIAAYGQVQCHGGSSVLAFFLLPFAKALGVDVKYRGGYTFGSGHDVPGVEAVNRPETHQWLEVTYHPSAVTCVCDVFLKRMNWPMGDAYTDMMYPNGALICGTTILERAA